MRCCQGKEPKDRDQYYPVRAPYVQPNPAARKRAHSYALDVIRRNDSSFLCGMWPV